MAEGVAAVLGAHGIAVKVSSVGEATDQELADVDYLLLGCWTSGLLVALQHPERAWADFARRLPDLRTKRIGLFTTYKVATGRMFKRMAACLPAKVAAPSLTLRSRSGRLSPKHEAALAEWVAA
jgi:hypothetical protein